MTMDGETSGVDIALALGGNLGRTEEVFASCVDRLAAKGLGAIRMASCYRTAPADCVPGTPDFLNSALTGRWNGSPEALLALCQETERAFGRPARHSSHESRPLDLDILLFGTQMVDLPNLVIPHPRMLLRRFVMEPLHEVAPNWPVPPTMTTVAAIWKKRFAAGGSQ